MFMGNDPRPSDIWNMFASYCWAERDLGVFPSEIAAKLCSFQPWVEQRFPFCQGYPWHRAFTILALESAAISFEYFYSSFDMFMAGGSPDDLGAWAKKMADAMTEGDGSDVDDALKKVIRKISPQ